MRKYKFDDCVDCRFKRRKDVCRKCEFGEYFEDAEIVELSFRDNEMFERSEKALSTDDDEPNHNPDDFLDKLEDQEEDELMDDMDEDDDE